MEDFSYGGWESYLGYAVNCLNVELLENKLYSNNDNIMILIVHMNKELYPGIYQVLLILFKLNALSHNS